MSPNRRIRFLILITVVAVSVVTLTALYLFRLPHVNQALLLVSVSLIAALIAGLLLVAVGRPLSDEVREIQERFNKYYDIGLVGIADTSLETG